MGPTGCLETSARNYQSTLVKIPEHRRYHVSLNVRFYELCLTLADKPTLQYCTVFLPSRTVSAGLNTFTYCDAKCWSYRVMLFTQGFMRTRITRSQANRGQLNDEGFRLNDLCKILWRCVSELSSSVRWWHCTADGDFPVPRMRNFRINCPSDLSPCRFIHLLAATDFHLL